ncbi:hypothetical protein ACFWNI_33445 [Streptomyces sp. NPDC058377]|uniref:hypothetical protein n=1 Tax=Streptomyces sp. NPDC058377 TaxID=3346468 RepID=UPI00365EEF63
MTTLNFVLQGRDALSRTLNGAGDSADRLRRRLDDAANNSSRTLAGFTRDADGRLRDLQGRFIATADAAGRMRDGVNGGAAPFARLRNSAREFGDELKASLISLAPAAIPAVAGLAGAAAAVGAQLGAAGVAAGAYALALGPQIGAITEAREAHKKYEEAVEESGRTSAEATEAQVAYQRKLAALPPETREAAVAVGLLSDSFSDWSDSLAGDVMGPFTKGVAVTNALLPKTTGLVKGTSTQVDRLITLVGGGVASPGFDRLNDRFTTFANKTTRDAVDGVVRFFDQLDRGEISDSGLQEFFEYCRENGPAVRDTLQNVGEAALHVLEAGSGVGVGMLDLINMLSGIVAAVPPGAISTLLQMAIAIKAVRLAAAGGAAASAALGALTGQLVLMRTAATGAPTRLAAVGAAINTLSRTAKLAIAGTGIGLLLIGLSQLSQRGKDTPPDVDKLTTSLGRLGQSGKVSGEALKAFGPNLDGLTESIRTLADPSTTQQIEKFFSDLLGYGEGGPGLKKAAEDVDAVDKALANLVSRGKAELAAAALDEYTKRAGMSSEEVASLRGQLDDYTESLAAQAFEQRLAAEAQGTFGAQAQQVQAQLEAQRQSADGLSQSIHALNNAYLQARGGVRGMEAAIDAASESFKKNGRTLDENTEKGRANNQSLDDLAAATMKAAEAARANGASWDTVSGIQDRGRQAFIRSAMQMGKNERQAKALADQILRTPDKTAYLKGDLDDLRAKLADAKERLAKAPSSKTAKIKGEISDLQRKIKAAQSRIDAMRGRTIVITTRHVVVGDGSAARHSGSHGSQLKYAAGGPVGFPGGGPIQGPGTGTSDSILIRASNGEYVVKATSVARYGLPFMDALNSGKLPAGRAAPVAGRPAAVASAATTAAPGSAVTYNLYPRASVISVEDLRLVQRQEEARQRVGRPR